MYEKFDIIISVAVFMHLNVKQIQKVIKNMKPKFFNEGEVMSKITEEQIKDVYNKLMKYSNKDLQVFQNKTQSHIVNKVKTIILDEANFNWNETSLSDYINTIIYMIKGQVFARTVNSFAEQYFIHMLHKDFGENIYKNAQRSLQLHKEYYKKIIEESKLKKIIKIFRKKWDTTNELWKQEYINGLSKSYRGLKINISFGIGARISNPDKFPYINFLKDDFKTNKGIYPFIAYHYRDGYFEIGLGISRDNEPDVTQIILDAIDNYQSKNIFVDDIDKVITTINEVIDAFENIVNNEDRKNKNNNQNIYIPNQNQSKNQILYGPPGTGKTYNTINKAIEIIEDRKLTTEELENRERLKNRFDEYKKAGQIEFITFHQSYGYEEFIEGIKADINNNDEIIYTKEDGIFKKFTLEAIISTIQITRESVKTIGFDEVYDGLLEKIINGEIGSLSSKTANDIVVSGITKNGNINFKHKDGNKKYLVSKARLKKLFEYFNVKEKFDSISNINEEFRKVIGGCNTSAYWAVLNYIHTNNIEDEYQDIDIENMTEIEQKELIENYLKTHQSERKQKDHIKNYILIIDEINRGNISKIFGELITLLEDSKRISAKDELKVSLPYTNDLFGIPQNLYLLGTMNTADRSIALLDTALRRRFEFVEMMPDLETLKDIEVEGVDIYALLEAINKRIEYLYDRDHTIGHAYFIELKEDDKNNLPTLSNIFKNKIIPLLQEYFYDDWEKINLVLNNNGFIKNKSYNQKELFSNCNLEEFDDEKIIYQLDKDALENKDNYIKIYQ